MGLNQPDLMKALLADQRTGADTLMAATILGLHDDDLTAFAHYAASR
jgi:hypothetical protein